MLRWGSSLFVGLLLFGLPGQGGGRAPTESPIAQRVGSNTRSTALLPQDPELRPAPGFPVFLRHLPPRPGEIVPPVAAPAPVVPTNRREIILTFDDGPDLETTPQVLDLLDRHHIKAIFFISGGSLVGERAADRARRQLVRTLVEHGHLVGNHSISHHDMCLEPQHIDREIDGNEEFVTSTAGLRPVLFRSPYGARCRALDDALSARGLINVGWNVDPQEWRGEVSPTEIADRVIAQLRALQGRGILLLHDTKRATVAALPRILDFIDEARGWTGKGQSARPITPIDYSVFLPEITIAPIGVESLAARVISNLTVVPSAIAKGW
jgi:peptidoglycan-N-acetylglucosamine deacetylase